MNTRYRSLKWNSILALVYQVILIVTGLILPRCFLYFYGSEVNGLISSITQFLSFINICDLGISAVVSSAYYKPLADRNTAQISRVFAYSKRFFRVVGCILTGYIAVLLAIYPTLINHTFDYWFTATLIAAMGISQLGQYFIGITYQLLLNSDQKSSIQLLVNGSTLLVNTAVSVALMVSGAPIQLVKLATSLIYLLRPLLLYLYVKKHYELDLTVAVDRSVVPQKSSGIIQHIAYMIYENTDVMVLTVFSTLKNVSVYSVYTLVTNCIKQLITAATTGVQALLGNMLARGERQELRRFYTLYDWCVHTVSTLLFTVTGLLIVPFVKVYTAQITDADYEAPLFAALICLAYFLSSIRNCNYTLIRAAGHYRQTQAASLIEAVTNLSLSIVCVFRFGLIGVAFGTVAATAFFVVYEMIYFSRNIVFVRKTHYLKLFATDALTAAVGIGAAMHIRIFTGSLLSWLLQAALVFAVCTAVSLIVQLLFYRENLLAVKKRILRGIFGRKSC